MMDQLQSLRLECLRAAVAAAQTGVAYDVYSTAQQYLDWVTGVPRADPNEGLNFTQRLDALVQEFLREEKSDGRKIMNDIAEYFSRLDQTFPQPSKDEPAFTEKVKDRFTQPLELDPEGFLGRPLTNEEKVLFRENVSVNPDGTMQSPGVLHHVHKEIQS